jgi:uncharacterized membrane protein YecN with MAPEG domain
MNPFPIPITAVFAGILAVMLVGISIRVTRLRAAKKISLADGGDKQLQAAIRVQGNFTEYVPMALILMGLLESAGAKHWIVYLFGSLLVVARIAHAYALYAGFFPLRVVGTSTTWALIAIGGLLIIGLSALERCARARRSPRSFSSRRRRRPRKPRESRSRSPSCSSSRTSCATSSETTRARPTMPCSPRAAPTPWRR